MNKYKQIALRIAELLLFFFALAMLVPPIPSDAHIVSRLTPVLILGGGSFAVSLLFAIQRKGEDCLTAALKLLFYLGLAWIIHERIVGHAHHSSRVFSAVFL